MIQWLDENAILDDGAVNLLACALTLFPAQDSLTVPLNDFLRVYRHHGLSSRYSFISLFIGRKSIALRYVACCHRIRL